MPCLLELLAIRVVHLAAHFLPLPPRRGGGGGGGGGPHRAESGCSIMLGWIVHHNWTIIIPDLQPMLALQQHRTNV